MRFKDVFSIIGPAMIGPSSSHTAGAVRLGRVARQLLGRLPKQAKLELFGSFADTYQGHGTDVALVGGLLGYDTDNMRIRYALDDAREMGMQVVFEPGKGLAPHPNTVRVTLQTDDASVRMIGASIGGGNIEIYGVDDFRVKFTGDFPTILAFHDDRPGVIADITRLLSEEQLNIGHMQVDRTSRSAKALTVIEVDNHVPEALLESLRALPPLHDVRLMDITGR